MCQFTKIPITSLNESFWVENFSAVFDAQIIFLFDLFVLRSTLLHRNQSPPCSVPRELCLQVFNWLTSQGKYIFSIYQDTFLSFFFYWNKLKKKKNYNSFFLLLYVVWKKIIASEGAKPQSSRGRSYSRHMGSQMCQMTRPSRSLISYFSETMEDRNVKFWLNLHSSL